MQRYELLLGKEITYLESDETVANVLLFNGCATIGRRTPPILLANGSLIIFKMRSTPLTLILE